MRSRLAYIVSACRTPIGVYNGGLASLTGPQLGAIAGNAAIDRINFSREAVDECIFGQVITANVGQNPARQVSRACNLPHSVPATTVNKVCSSGLKAVSFAAQSIELGQAGVVLCGGMESMSNAPYYNTKARFGQRMGNFELIDGMIRDGLSDAWDFTHMGVYAEQTAREHLVTRTKQDDYAIESYERAQMAYQRSIFDFEIAPVEIPDKKGGSPTRIEKDEGCWKLNPEKLRKLKPAFAVDGTVTAGNASQLSDAGAALLLASEDAVREHNLKPLAKILAYADAEQAPEHFPTTPSIAIPKALGRAGIDLKSLTQEDFFEINEAFAVVGYVNRKLLDVNQFNFNIYGGGVALGHPIGCSGARILVTLITALKENAGRYGIAGICNGGGGSTAMVIENMV